MRRRDFLKLAPLAGVGSLIPITPALNDAGMVATTGDAVSVEINTPISEIVIFDIRDTPNANVQMVAKGGKTLVRILR